MSGMARALLAREAGDNAMLTALSTGDVEHVLERLPDRVREALASPGARGTPSPRLVRAIADGARIAGVLARLPADVGKQRWDEHVVRAVLAELAA
jgi:hypothetical protein